MRSSVVASRSLSAPDGRRGCRSPRGRTAPPRPPDGRSVGGGSGRRCGAAPERPAQHDSWLSSRAELTNSSSSPARRPGCTSWAMTSHDARRRRSTPTWLGQVGGEAAGRRAGAEAPGRHQVLLRVELQADLVDLAVEVDGQLGHPQQRPVVAEQHACSGPLAAEHGHPSRQAEVAVEPRVQQHPAVDLDAELAPAGPARCRAGASPAGWGCRCGRRPPGSRRRPAAAPASPAQATRLPPRTRKWRPGAIGQESISRTSAKPAATSRRAASATAWNGEGDASMKASRSRARRPGSVRRRTAPEIRAQGVRPVQGRRAFHAGQRRWWRRRRSAMRACPPEMWAGSELVAVDAPAGGL